jgi:hypothetical protein
MPFRAAYAEVARQLQAGSFRPVAVTASRAAPEAAQRALTEITVTLADSKNWIRDRRRLVSITTERLFNWP